MMSFNRWMTQEDKNDEEMDQLAHDFTTRFIKKNPDLMDDLMMKMVQSLNADEGEKEWDTNSDS